MPTALEALPGFSFGCDPELFIYDQNKERFVSAEGLIPGTKENPYKVTRGAVQVDGMAAEFNIDPVRTFDDFYSSIEIVLQELKSFLPRGHKLMALPSVTFDEDVWEATPDVAKILGCNPDFNAWTGKVNSPPDASKNPRLRTASGHLHIGWTEDAAVTDKLYVQNARDLVKQLDWWLGGWSLRVDSDPVRRSLYGKAGAMRFKPYGAEYRVLSNFWLKNRATALQVWNRMQRAIHDMTTNFLPEQAPYQFNELLVRSIDESKLNETLLSCFSTPLKSM